MAERTFKSTGGDYSREHPSVLVQISVCLPLRTCSFTRNNNIKCKEIDCLGCHGNTLIVSVLPERGGLGELGTVIGHLHCPTKQKSINKLFGLL